MNATHKSLRRDPVQALKILAGSHGGVHLLELIENLFQYCAFPRLQCFFGNGLH